MERIGNWIRRDFDVTTSTNDEAEKYLKSETESAVITAKMQTAGRGRRGRSWISQEGNLFMSLVFQADPKDLGQLVILSGLAVRETILKLAPTAEAEVKWPNDVFVGGCKISGILFERAENGWWIMGVGINVVSAPEKGTMYSTTSLKTLGIQTTREEVLRCFIEIFERLMQQRKEQGFDPIRKSWLDKAYKLGKKILIKQEEKSVEGIFTGIDDSGSLQLQTADGLQKIIVGDVF